MDEAVWFRLMSSHCFILLFTGITKYFYLRTYNIAFGQINSLIYNKMYFLLDKEQCGILTLTVMVINNDKV